MSKVEQVASEALLYLAETDEDCARAKAAMKGLEYAIKRTFSQEFLNADGKTGAEKTAQAHASAPYMKITEDYENAVLDYELLATKRSTQTARFEWARSMNANRRQGGGNL